MRTASFKRNVVITGDFNINLCSSSADSSYLRAVINDSSLYLVPSEPTHHAIWRDHLAHTWLDIFIVRESASIASSVKSSEPLITGHDFIQLKLNCAAPPPLSPIHSLLSPVHLFAVTLSGVHLPTYFSPECFTPDQVALGLDNLLHHTYDFVAPLTPICISVRRKPWVSHNIRMLIPDRDKAFKRAKLIGSQ